MRKMLCLLLCLLMLFCIGCQKEDAPEPQLNQGTFYTSDGTQYNTHVRMELTSTDLTTAATTLSVAMHNDTDYVILLRSDPKEYPWEKMGKNGEWVKVPPIPYDIDENGDSTDIGFRYIKLLPHSTYYSTNVFSELETGSYRLRVIVDVTNVQSPLSPGENYEISPETRCYAELQFAIVPAPEA